MPAVIESAATDIVLRDGSTAYLRPARHDDRAALLEFYQRLSPDSRYFRFFGKPRVDDIVDDAVQAMAEDGTCTLVAEIDRRIVAIGQYFADPSNRRRSRISDMALDDADVNDVRQCRPGDCDSEASGR